MKKVYLAFAAVLAVSTLFLSGCSKDSYDEEIVEASSNLIYETTTFSCYSFNTKGASAGYDELITVNDLPDTKIYLGKNNLTKAFDGYEYVASYEKEGKAPMTVYLNYAIQDNGYLLNYLTESGEKFDYFVPFSPDPETKAKDRNLGQDVMDCMTDVYSNHGWLSVWVFVQTCFIPETAVAFAAACLGANI